MKNPTPFPHTQVAREFISEFRKRHKRKPTRSESWAFFLGMTKAFTIAQTRNDDQPFRRAIKTEIQIPSHEQK